MWSMLAKKIWAHPPLQCLNKSYRNLIQYFKEILWMLFRNLHSFLSIGQVFFRIWVFSYPQNCGFKRKNTIRENTNLAHFTRWIYVTSLWHFYPNVSHKVSAVGIKEMHTFEEMQETFISLMIDKFIIIHRGWIKTFFTL